MQAMSRLWAAMLDSDASRLELIPGRTINRTLNG